MLCPEGSQALQEPQENTTKTEGEKLKKKSSKKVHGGEGNGNLELKSFKNPNSWKKSLSKFFRNSVRSTRSNDGDQQSESEDDFGNKDVSREQKWQSLGKVFRRQSFAGYWEKSPNQQGECSSPNKRLGVKKVLSSYFGKMQKPTTEVSEKCEK